MHYEKASSISKSNQSPHPQMGMLMRVVKVILATKYFTVSFSTMDDYFRGDFSIGKAQILGKK